MIKSRRVKLHWIEKKNQRQEKEKEPKKNVGVSSMCLPVYIPLSLSQLTSSPSLFLRGPVVSYILLALRSRSKLRGGKRRSYNVPTRE